MPSIDWMSAAQQSSVNAGGLLSPHGFFVPARIHITATRGIVGTAYGIPAVNPPGGSGAPGFPGMGVTCLPNGVYDVIHPPTRFAQCWPSVQSASGVTQEVSVVRDKTHPYTGITRLAMVNGSGAAAVAVSGTIIDLLYYVSPSSTPGIVPF